MMRHADVPADVERTATLVLDAAMEVHRALGPGLRETFYRHCLLLELRRAGAQVDEEVSVDLFYKGMRLEKAARFDLLVNDHLLVELKAVDPLPRVAFLQTRSYVRFAAVPLGILVNFHAPRLIDGWHRILPGRLPPLVASSRRRMRQEETQTGQEASPSAERV